MIKKLTLSDLENKINYAVANNITTHFTVLGDLCADILDYCEYEHNLKQWVDVDEEPLYDFESNVVYTLTIYDGEYYVQEAYYQHEDGEILASYGEEDEIAYVEIETELTTLDMQRILCGKVEVFQLDTEVSFDYEEDYDYEESDYKSLCPNTQCEKCGECFATYKVNGKEVDKETYDKKAKEIEYEFDKFRHMFDTRLDKLLDYFYENC